MNLLILDSFYLFNYVIVVMLLRCQNLKHRTLRKKVDLGLELCLIFVLLRVFLNFFKSCLMFSGPFKIIQLSENVIRGSYVQLRFINVFT